MAEWEIQSSKRQESAHEIPSQQRGVFADFCNGEYIYPVYLDSLISKRGEGSRYLETLWIINLWIRRA